MKLLKTAKQVLSQIEKRDGIVTPQTVVNDSRDVSSPLHEYFEWDDEMAGEGYRRWQARQLIRKVTVEYAEKETNAFYNVTVQLKGKSQRGYVSLVKVLSDEDLKRQVLKSALRELKYWQAKYREYEELMGLIDAQKVKRLSDEV